MSLGVLRRRPDIQYIDVGPGRRRSCAACEQEQRVERSTCEQRSCPRGGRSPVAGWVERQRLSSLLSIEDSRLRGGGHSNGGRGCAGATQFVRMKKAPLIRNVARSEDALVLNVTDHRRCKGIALNIVGRWGYAGTPGEGHAHCINHLLVLLLFYCFALIWGCRCVAERKRFDVIACFVHCSSSLTLLVRNFLDFLMFFSNWWLVYVCNPFSYGWTNH